MSESKWADVLAENEKLRAEVARVEALALDWERRATVLHGTDWGHTNAERARSLRLALARPDHGYGVTP